MVMQIRRTTTGGPPTGLQAGQLSVEMLNPNPRLWVGVPTSVASIGRLLVSDQGSLGGFPISGIPTNGQVLAFNSGTNQWNPTTPTGGSGPGGDSLVIGTPSPSPAADSGSIVANYFSSRGMEPAGEFDFNIYFVGGVRRYLENGPGATIGVHNSSPAGGSAARLAFAVEDINNGGAGALAPTSTTGVLNLISGPPGQGSINPWALIGNANDMPVGNPSRATLMANQITIQPGQTGAVGATSRLGLNIYLDQTGAWRYAANGPGAAIVMQSSAPSGPGSRISMAVADINSGGSGAAASLEGILNLEYGPPGGGTSNGYVVVGNLNNVLANPPSFGSLVAQQLVIEPGVVAARDAPTARLGLNMYLAPDGNFRYTDNGPAAMILMQGSTPLGGPGSRLNFSMSDINASGPGALATNLEGVLNILYGPTGSAAGTGGYVVIGSAGYIPAAAPTYGSLMCESIIVEPGTLGPGTQGSRIGLNTYFGLDGGWHYIDNGPGAMINVATYNPNGPPESRLTISIADINAGGSGATCNTFSGVINLVAPPGGGSGSAFVIIGGAPFIPVATPPPDSLIVVGELHVGPQAFQSRAPGSIVCENISFGDTHDFRFSWDGTFLLVSIDHTAWRRITVT